MRACFWIDAGRQTGGGHVTRAEALAGALAPLGFDSTILADDPSAVRAAGCERLEVAALGDEGFAATCARRGARLAIVDLPHTRPAEPAELDALTALGIPSVAFDSSDPSRSRCDLWVDASGPEPPSAPSSPSLVCPLLGPRYAVLRRGLGPGLAADDDEPGAPLPLLVGFGAADPARLTARALRALAPLGERLGVDVLLGPLVPAEAKAEVETAARALSKIRVHQGVRDPLPLLQRARLGLFAFGNLFLEALACGVPCVLWHPSAAHAAIAQRFASQCADPVALDLGDATATSTADDAGLRERVTDLLEDGGRRRALSRAAVAAVDGRGAERVARAAARLVGA